MKNKTTKYTTVIINREIKNNLFGFSELYRTDSRGDLVGIRGWSTKPRWTGEWDGLMYHEFKINLSERGINYLKEIVERSGYNFDEVVF